ncbi:hypothetical protein P154DRAFT_570903 [Amniculicola lignicola CBS 123094]|uniref:Uncharacterized protein n=1 Tax=Amniculicola lignicola CBS 123094 TaxID=1392246 RepID=A0A6A5WUV4_9PLEO|nr:hypothetical protein P154DRAFT_570903 [Amniculicola lignicola CBS 123094]
MSNKPLPHLPSPSPPSSPPHTPPRSPLISISMHPRSPSPTPSELEEHRPLLSHPDSDTDSDLFYADQIIAKCQYCDSHELAYTGLGPSRLHCVECWMPQVGGCVRVREGNEDRAEDGDRDKNEDKDKNEERGVNGGGIGR